MIQDQLRKLEFVKMKRLAREQDKIIKQLRKEEEIQEKRERANLEKLQAEDLKRANSRADS